MQIFERKSAYSKIEIVRKYSYKLTKFFRLEFVRMALKRIYGN